jgi:hypothetical protein
MGKGTPGNSSNKCAKCHRRHGPPTGALCTLEPLENEGNDTSGEGTSQQPQQGQSVTVPDGQVQQPLNGENASQDSNDAALQGSVSSQQSGSSATIAMANDIKHLAATVTGVSVQCQENRAELSELRAHVTYGQTTCKCSSY